ncbi:DUF2237 family protein [Halorhodospira halophila]|uniref:DUF2237 domain-containing protein n=1 Tax=Halorhodospira halophila (strain DSM 244 / SL1) TaxID=349124 RepID=A1WWK7_HALHL|nr:DUF2237 domain-containing protein [Halorhodospira halophila]ABM62069.1 conserved hypothetical protein [Halorhodospira halophila SL1]MBK1730168.1 DUF2237 domain-containing protein [Halorhodospira halophila]
MSQPFESLNVLGQPLAPCSTQPLTGFYRDGCCNTGHEDVGIHTVCARLDEAFLSFTREQGNDLTAPNPGMGFPGLQPGDRWCRCAGRWMEAYRAGVAPMVDLHAKHAETLAVIDLDTLKAYAL